MADPKTLSVREISAATKSAVAKVVDQNRGKLLKPPYIFGFFPPWWCGFIIRSPDEKFTLGETRKIAADVHKSIAAAVPGAKGGKPGAVLEDGIITIGFAPPIEVLIKE